jgi:trans-aconitate 2-methyltransferase
MSDSPRQSWDPALYDDRHSFVWKLAEDLIELLAPAPGERILDLGCGTGALTARLAERGAVVVGLDNSPAMLEKARAAHSHLRFELGDATTFSFPEPFDAVFSNAALHWVRDARAAVRRIAAALKPGGRFVAEFGGAGNCAGIMAALADALRAEGREPPAEWSPWYFPTVEEYTALLARHGLRVEFAELFDRPTELDGGDAGLRGWIDMFGRALLAPAAVERREPVIAEAERRLRPSLFRGGKWLADYRRIRVKAVKARPV